MFIAFNLPSAFLCGVRLKFIDGVECRVRVSYKWINRNPFKSMYWAVQGMAAELSTGALIISKIKKLKRNISMLVIRSEAHFTKKARGKILFECKQGSDIDDVLKKVIESGQTQTILLEAYGHDNYGNQVSNFSFEWTLKLKS